MLRRRDARNAAPAARRAGRPASRPPDLSPRRRRPLPPAPVGGVSLPRVLPRPAHRRSPLHPLRSSPGSAGGRRARRSSGTTRITARPAVTCPLPPTPERHRARPDAGASRRAGAGRQTTHTTERSGRLRRRSGRHARPLEVGRPQNSATRPSSIHYPSTTTLLLGASPKRSFRAKPRGAEESLFSCA